MDFFKKPKAADIAQQLVGREVNPLVAQEQQEPDHKHEWELLSKTTAPSRRDIPQTNFDKEVLERMLFGVTVFLWECLICRVLRKETILGSDVTQLDELIDKADKFGPQYINRTDGQLFVVAKWTHQNQPGGQVPVR